MPGGRPEISEFLFGHLVNDRNHQKVRETHWNADGIQHFFDSTQVFDTSSGFEFIAKPMVFEYEIFLFTAGGK